MKPEMIPTLRKAVEWAEVEAAKPNGQWFQDQVYTETVCGTTYCIAGWVVAQHHGVKNPYDAKYQHGGVMNHAADLLGLRVDEAHDLFGSGIGIKKVRRVAERIAGEPL